MSRPAFDVSSLFIRAGAGAGKTTQLIASFGDFVKAFQEKTGRYPKIVITTFTRKATQEVKERLLVNALKQNDQGVFEYINKKSFVQISTIHGLLNLFLAQNAEALALPQDLKIVDQIKSDRLLKKSIHALMKKNTRFIELLEAYPFYRLVGIAREALNLKYQHPDLNFVNDEVLKASTEQKRKIVLDKVNSVLHGMGGIPEKWQLYFSFLKDYESLLAQNQIDEAIAFFDSEPKKPAFLKKTPPFDESLHQLIEEIRDQDRFLFSESSEYRDQHQKLNRLFDEFLKALFTLDLENKRRSGELTIADLENYSLRLIQQSPDLAADFSRSWDFFMIDEYQDTSPLQVEILNHLVGEKPCFIVGDPQQSIYLFRGARSEVFDAKELELKKRNVEIKVLNVNYRSEPKLMSFINEFFSGFKQIFKPMQLKPTTAAPEIKEQVHFIQTYDQAKAALKQIHYLLEEGAEAKDICVLSRKNADLSDIAQAAHAHQIPVQLQSAAGFEMKREILDLVAFLKFLANPFDSENLVTVLRSPWFFIDDQTLTDISQGEAARFSLWDAITAKGLASPLRTYRDDYEKRGASFTLRKFILNSGFLAFSDAYDITGRREANIWKFLTSFTTAERQAGFSLSLYLEDQFQSLLSDLGGAGGEAQPVIQPDRVSLMTVHAAKGLEFKHVIVIGFTDRPQQTTTLPLAYDPKTSLYSLAVFSEDEAKHVTSAWATQVRKELNQRELLEHERVLYVAMTRAQESLSLVAEMGSAEKKKIIVSESWFKKIPWPEQAQARENYSSRSEFYDEKIQIVPAKKSFDFPLREKKYISRHELESQSVTEMISGPRGPNLQKTQWDQNVRALKKAQRGTELHRVFESLKYLPLEDLKRELAPDEQRLIQYLLELKEIDLKQVLEKGHNEWGFGLRYPKGLLQGQIDAWGELENEIHVLDYKTGSPAFAPKAFDQLAVYTYALLKMKKISENKQIVFSVIYPVDQRVIQKTYINANDFLQKEAALTALFLETSN